MAKKKKNDTVKIVAILTAIILGLYMCNNQETGGIVNNSTSGGTSQSTYSSGGGGGGGGTSSSTSDSTEDYSGLAAFLIWLQNQDSTPECSKDSDCINTCAGQYYACTDAGQCTCTPPPTEEEPEVSCSDTDGGYLDGSRLYSTENYEEKGTCTEGISRGVSDYCNSRGQLVEYYCDNGCAYKTIDCADLYRDNDVFCYDGMCTWLA